MALATTGGEAAILVLKEALYSENTDTRIAALDAVRITGDASWCPFLKNTLNDPDPNIRYYAVNTAASLGCLDHGILNGIAVADPDEHVRQLAGTWLGNSRNNQ
jgi:HEAT repeat protein